MELSTAAMNVAIRQAASTSVRRAEGELRYKESGPRVVAECNPSSGTG